MSFTDLFCKTIKNRNYNDWEDKGENLQYQNNKNLKSIPKNTTTEIKSSKGVFYTVAAIWYCHKYRNLDFGKYVSLCLEKRLERVNMVDRKKILRYLKRKSNNFEDDNENEKMNIKLEKRLRKTKILKMSRKNNMFTYDCNSLSKLPSVDSNECFELMTSFEKRLSGDSKQTKSINNSDKNEKETPIILVPSAISAILNIYNAKNFLEKNNLMNTAEGDLNQQINNIKISVNMFPDKRTINFEITDKIKNSEDWNRVVAVIVSGKNWQFKKYKYKPPLLFSKSYY